MEIKNFNPDLLEKYSAIHAKFMDAVMEDPNKSVTKGLPKTIEELSKMSNNIAKQAGSMLSGINNKLWSPESKTGERKPIPKKTKEKRKSKLKLANKSKRINRK